MKKLNTDLVITKLKDIYEDTFLYDKVNYINSRSKIILTCKIHGDFEVSGNTALVGRAKCPICADPKYQFTEKVKAKYKDLFNLSNLEYITLQTPTEFECIKHGKFIKTPSSLLNTGCPECTKEVKEKSKSIKLSKEDKAKLRAEEWKEKCSKIWDNKYDYSKIDYLYSTHDKIIYTCPIHGEIEQVAKSHYTHGCNKCGRIVAGQSHMHTLEEFEIKASKLHSPYTFGTYKGLNQYMDFYCKEHGKFLCTPNNFLKGSGCPKCSRSDGERLVANVLDSLNISYKELIRFKLPKSIHGINMLIPDFIFTYNNQTFIIEYNGELHYKFVNKFFKDEAEFILLKFRDRVLRLLCNIKHVKLLEIRYDFPVLDIETLIKNFINYENEA